MKSGAGIEAFLWPKERLADSLRIRSHPVRSIGRPVTKGRESSLQVFRNHVQRERCLGYAPTRSPREGSVVFSAQFGAHEGITPHTVRSFGSDRLDQVQKERNRWLKSLGGCLWEGFSKKPSVIGNCSFHP